MSNMKLTIDQEFEDLCPRLTAEEYAKLEQSLIDDGCRDPITVWANHEDTIIDGHNRYRICQINDIPFKTRAWKLETRGDVINWIITNQLGRRNLTEEQKAYLRGKRYRAEQGNQRDNLRRGSESPKDQNDPSGDTAERIAAELHVGSATVKRDAKFADAVDAVAEAAGPDAKAAILSGELGVSKSDVQKLAALPPKQQKAAIKGGKEAIRAAVAGTEGRPELKAHATEAMQFAMMAISQLERIREDDPKREEALIRVVDWINDHRS